MEKEEELDARYFLWPHSSGSWRATLQQLIFIHRPSQPQPCLSSRRCSICAGQFKGALLDAPVPAGSHLGRPKNDRAGACVLSRLAFPPLGSSQPFVSRQDIVHVLVQTSGSDVMEQVAWIQTATPWTPTCYENERSDPEVRVTRVDCPLKRGTEKWKRHASSVDTKDEEARSVPPRGSVIQQVCDQSSAQRGSGTQNKRKAIVVRKESADAQEYEWYQQNGMDVDEVKLCAQCGKQFSWMA